MWILYTCTKSRTLLTVFAPITVSTLLILYTPYEPYNVYIPYTLYTLSGALGICVLSLSLFDSQTSLKNQNRERVHIF